jgi:hypothetical protein
MVLQQFKSEGLQYCPGIFVFALFQSDNFIAPRVHWLRKMVPRCLIWVARFKTYNFLHILLNLAIVMDAYGIFNISGTPKSQELDNKSLR